MDQRQIRKIRLKNDYTMLKNMSNSLIEITGDDTEAPEKYTIVYNLRTIIGVDTSGKPIYREKSTVDLTIPPEYPYAPPRAVMRETQPWHPNWYTDHAWCYGYWDNEEPLWSYIRRMGRTIQFHPDYTNPGSPANSEALEFWNNANNKRLFPCDKNNLPTGDRTSRIKILSKKS